MAELNEQKDEIMDFSGAVERKTSRFMQRDNEVDVGENASFDELGGFGKKLGYIQQGSDLTSTTSTSTSSSTTTTSTSTSSSTTTSTSTSTSSSTTTSTSTTTTA